MCAPRKRRLNRRGRVNQNNLMFKWIPTTTGTGYGDAGALVPPSEVWNSPCGRDAAARPYPAGSFRGG